MTAFAIGDRVKHVVLMQTGEVVEVPARINGAELTGCIRVYFADGIYSTEAVAAEEMWTLIQKAPPVKTVPHGHCGRCVRCGWALSDNLHDGCLAGNCSQRPLPAIRSHCAGCGAPYEAVPAAPADDADDTVPRISIAELYGGRT